jgi:hypothetical protein
VRPPLYCYRNCALDLHVLSTPPAFALSQDQTLMLNWLPRKQKGPTTISGCRTKVFQANFLSLDSLNQSNGFWHISSYPVCQRAKASCPAGRLQAIEKCSTAWAKVKDDSPACCGKSRGSLLLVEQALLFVRVNRSSTVLHSRGAHATRTHCLRYVRWPS